MPSVLSRVMTTLAVSSVVAVVLLWGRLPGRARRAVALVTSSVGLITLVLALQTEGQHEAHTTTQFLMGERFVSGTTSASASLPYYVLTGICLLLGTLGLAAPDDVARRLDRHWLATAVGLGIGVTAVRFTLEKVAAPASWTYPVGVTWLGPVMGAYFLHRLRQTGAGFGALTRYLLAFGLMVRGTVAAVMATATYFHLGTHYDWWRVLWIKMPFTHRIQAFEPGSLGQILYLAVLPQITFWVGHTVVAGLMGAALFALVTSIGRRYPVPSLRPHVGMAAAPPDR